MASRPTSYRWVGLLPANHAKRGLWAGRVLSQVSPGFPGVLSTNCPPRRSDSPAAGSTAPTPRQIGVPLGMAPDHRHAHPAQALRAPERPRSGLTSRAGGRPHARVNQLPSTPRHARHGTRTYATASMQGGSTARRDRFATAHLKSSSDARHRWLPFSPLVVGIGERSRVAG
jgi:hypothetical protein